MTADYAVVPFLKWAGGKRWLVERYPELFAQDFRFYIEPFLGSGAVFFFLKPRKAILADVNEDLIVTYRAIKETSEKVEKELRRHDRNHSTTYYYRMRRYLPRAEYKRAARLIYLNRTCWNGLYRVNLRGQFNVPIGTKTRVILPTDRFSAIADMLCGAEVHRVDFETTINRAGKNDFLFIDPPYTAKHNLNGFVKYNERIFRWEDQVRLSESVISAKKRGARILMTNADHESVRKLYRKDFFLDSFPRYSVISGASSGRGVCSELIIRSA